MFCTCGSEVACCFLTFIFKMAVLSTTTTQMQHIRIRKDIFITLTYMIRNVLYKMSECYSHISLCCSDLKVSTTVSNSNKDCTDMWLIQYCWCESPLQSVTCNQHSNCQSQRPGMITYIIAVYEMLTHSIVYMIIAL